LEFAGGVLEFSERTGYLWNTSHDGITGVSSLLYNIFSLRLPLAPAILAVIFVGTVM
jgi:hypothetical protein